MNTENRGARPSHWGGGDWFAVPSAMYDSGELARLTPCELLVLLGLMRHATFEGGESYPGVERLASVCQRHPRNVERALNKLTKLGIVHIVEKGGGKNRANVFKLNSPNPGAGRSKPRRQRRGNKEEQNEQSSRNNPAAADVLDALAEAGIGGKKRARLAESWSGIPGAVATIRSTAVALAAAGKRTGALVEELEAQAEASRLKRDRATKVQRKRKQERVEEDKRRAEEAASVATPDQRHAGLDAMNTNLGPTGR